MPRGENPFAGVTYRIPDFRTSPVPSCIILRGKTPSVLGLKVGQKADALFFLHTFEASRQALNWKPGRRELDKAPPVVFQYVVRYADGKTEEVPVRCGEGVGHWLDKAPKALKSAAIGWSAPFANDDSGDQAVVYSMQWNNPRPDAEIESLDIALGPDGPRWGAPALLAVTAARAAK
jgi:beta-galactosidase